MFDAVLRRFQVDYILPKAERLGSIGTTKELYDKYLKIAWPATLQGLMLQFMTAIDLAMVGALGAEALAFVESWGSLKWLCSYLYEHCP